MRSALFGASDPDLLFDYFERLEALIISEERRFNEIMREPYRHRFMPPEQATHKKIRIENDCRQANDRQRA